MEELDRLIEILCDERGKRPPELTEEQKPLAFRGLCNLRPPKPVSAEFIELQDRYLSALTAKRGWIDAESLDYTDGVALWQGDILGIKADAIVNACNEQLLGCFEPLHGCIDNAIHSFAGVQVRLDCNEIMQGRFEPEGMVEVTRGYNLPAKYIFHTVGPMVDDGRPTAADRRSLASCYASCIEKAKEMNLKTLVFCCISTGVFGFPKRAAAKIAVTTTREHLCTPGNTLKVVFCIYDPENFKAYSQLLSTKPTN